MPIIQTRRRFLATAGLAGAAGVLRAPQSLAAEGPLETNSVRLIKVAALCLAPQYVAEELLRAEGFTDVRYVYLPPRSSVGDAVGRGEADFSLNFALAHVRDIDAGLPITVLAGAHAGCYELFASPGIRSITELKGKSVGLKSSPPELLSLMAAQVGLDPTKDIRWVTDPSANPIELFAAGKIDGFLGFPPEPQDLRARRIGHVIVNTAIDRPWSQYFCCMLAGNQEFVRKHPVATKRVTRAILSRQSRNQRGDNIVRRCQSCREPDDGVAHGAL